jgi:hypothetical protein
VIAKRLAVSLCAAALAVVAALADDMHRCLFKAGNSKPDGTTA